MCQLIFEQWWDGFSDLNLQVNYTQNEAGAKIIDFNSL